MISMCINHSELRFSGGLIGWAANKTNEKWIEKRALSVGSTNLKTIKHTYTYIYNKHIVGI